MQFDMTTVRAMPKHGRFRSLMVSRKLWRRNTSSGLEKPGDANHYQPDQKSVMRRKWHSYEKWSWTEESKMATLGMCVYLSDQKILREIQAIMDIIMICSCSTVNRCLRPALLCENGVLSLVFSSTNKHLLAKLSIIASSENCLRNKLSIDLWSYNTRTTLHTTYTGYRLLVMCYSCNRFWYHPISVACVARNSRCWLHAITCQAQQFYVLLFCPVCVQLWPAMSFTYARHRWPNSFFLSHGCYSVIPYIHRLSARRALPSLIATTMYFTLFILRGI